MKKFLILLFLSINVFSKPVIRVGSKNFTEGYILSEIIAQIIEDAGEAKVERRFGLGGTGITYNALETDEIDIYPEYTGTISEYILNKPLLRSIGDISDELANKNLSISSPIGFNNTYALALNSDFALKKQLNKISDLYRVQDIASGFTHEFIKRKDGIDKLQKHYNLKFTNINSIEHSLAYEAIASGKISLIDVYSTDAKINRYNLKLLEDDKKFFPEYLAVLIYKNGFEKKFPISYKALKEKLVGSITNETMIHLNSLVGLEGKNFSQAAGNFLDKKITKKDKVNYQKIKKLSLEHIKLVSVSLFFSILIAIPLGVISVFNRFFAQVFLGLSGLLQTIPSLALLCFLIPFFGIGEAPAYIALFLYGILPIVRGTYIGIKNINPKLIECSDLLGLSRMQKIQNIMLPLASPYILSGVKTSAVINVGTATLAAFIGAGGLGNLIVTGLAINDNSIILQGAIPTGLLALITQAFFEIIDRMIVPKGIRQ